VKDEKASVAVSDEYIGRRSRGQAEQGATATSERLTDSTCNNKTPSLSEGVLLFLYLFVRGSLFTRRAKLLELYFSLNFLLVFPAPIVDGLTVGTGKFYKLVLRHNANNLIKNNKKSK